MSETKFRHSKARVPRLYKEAAKIVQKVKEEGGSFKGLVFQCKHKKLKSLYALVAETLRYSSELNTLLVETQILQKEPRLDPWLARVLITELIWRQRQLPGHSVPLQIVQNYKSELLSKHASFGSKETQQVCRANRPRFVRVNTIKASVDEVVNYFLQEGWHEIDGTHDDSKKYYVSFLQKVSSFFGREFIRDVHVPSLLVFPGNMQFYDLELYHNGSILLQDKASCMSAHFLNAPVGSTVLDMCAAPGMKTTHIAATINNIGTVYAIEKHPGRYDSLCKMVSQAGAACVKPILGSALDFTDEDLPGVEYIVVDPTCSGSGMTNRKELFSDTCDISEARLEKLAGFQCAILRHAMLNFPEAKRIVYSTCSLCPEENEAVIEKVLKTTPPNFKPVIPLNGTDWMRRGSASYEFGEFGLYASPEIDLTNGFFVAVFERTENEYVSRHNLNQDLEKEEKPKKIKIKARKTARAENVSAAEPAINPALERIKRAMGNFHAAINTESSSEENTLFSENGVKEFKIKKEKKQKTCLEVVEEQVVEESDCVLPEESKKIKKRKNKSNFDIVGNISGNSDLTESFPKKKRKKYNEEIIENTSQTNEQIATESVSKKKKKKDNVS